MTHEERLVNFSDLYKEVYGLRPSLDLRLDVADMDESTLKEYTDFLINLLGR